MIKQTQPHLSSSKDLNFPNKSKQLTTPSRRVIPHAFIPVTRFQILQIDEHFYPHCAKIRYELPQQQDQYQQQKKIIAKYFGKKTMMICKQSDVRHLYQQWKYWDSIRFHYIPIALESSHDPEIELFIEGIRTTKVGLVLLNDHLRVPQQCIRKYHQLGHKKSRIDASFDFDRLLLRRSNSLRTLSLRLGSNATMKFSLQHNSLTSFSLILRSGYDRHRISFTSPEQNFVLPIVRNIITENLLSDATTTTTRQSIVPKQHISDSLGGWMLNKLWPASGSLKPQNRATIASPHPVISEKSSPARNIHYVDVDISPFDLDHQKEILDAIHNSSIPKWHIIATGCVEFPERDVSKLTGACYLSVLEEIDLLHLKPVNLAADSSNPVFKYAQDLKKASCKMLTLVDTIRGTPFEYYSTIIKRCKSLKTLFFRGGHVFYSSDQFRSSQYKFLHNPRNRQLPNIVVLPRTVTECISVRCGMPFCWLGLCCRLSLFYGERKLAFEYDAIVEDNSTPNSSLKYLRAVGKYSNQLTNIATSKYITKNNFKTTMRHLQHLDIISLEPLPNKMVHDLLKLTEKLQELDLASNVSADLWNKKFPLSKLKYLRKLVIYEPTEHGYDLRYRPARKQWISQFIVSLPQIFNLETLDIQITTVEADFNLLITLLKTCGRLSKLQRLSLLALMSIDSSTLNIKDQIQKSFNEMLIERSKEALREVGGDVKTTILLEVLQVEAIISV